MGIRRRQDDLLGWRLASSKHANHKTEYFDTDYATNALGYRDAARSPSVSKSHRLLLYGDSQVFGWGLPAAQRFSNLIEVGTARLEVWNLAVPGYGLDQQVLSYERDAAAWEADAAVFYVSRFTRQRLHHDYAFGFHKPSFRITGTDEIDVRPPKGYLPRRLVYALPGWMYSPYAIDRLLTRADQRWRTRLVVPTAQSAELLATVLGFAAQIGEERGHAIFVVSTQRAERDAPLRRLCAALEIRYLTLGLPAERSSLVWGPYDAHWNPAAHQQIADNLTSQLETAVSASELRSQRH